MYRTYRLVRLLAPVALIGSIAAAIPLAQAASGHRASRPAAMRSDGGGPTVGRGPTAHLRAYGGVAVFRGSAQHPAPSFCFPVGTTFCPKPS
jgi:hypothetical protein